MFYIRSCDSGSFFVCLFILLLLQFHIFYSNNQSVDIFAPNWNCESCDVRLWANEKEKERIIEQREARGNERAIYWHRVFMFLHRFNLTLFIKLFDWQLVAEQNDRHWKLLKRSAFSLEKNEKDKNKNEKTTKSNTTHKHTLNVVPLDVQLNRSNITQKASQMRTRIRPSIE